MSTQIIFAVLLALWRDEIIDEGAALACVQLTAHTTLNKARF
jgi:hypothetical protein